MTDAREAKTILGADCLTLDEVATAIGLDKAAVDPGVARRAERVPLSTDELAEAARRDQVLMFRLAQANSPLTITSLIDRFPSLFDPTILTKVGYMLRDEWGITKEPLAHRDVCTSGWALISKKILPATANLSYFDQDELLARGGEGRGFQRRTAVEAVFDLVVYERCRGVRLLIDEQDWTSSRTVDGGLLTVGGFAANGMQLVAFSTAVRHGRLGICPARNLS